MKRTLVYRFEDGEDDRLNRITHADDAYETLWDMQQWLRKEYKYVEQKDGVYDFIEKAREKFQEFMEENGINLDKDWS